MTTRILLIASVVMIVARAVAIVAMLSLLPSNAAGTDALGNDATRFHQIAIAEGRPYRDFNVEVGPVELLVIEWIDGATSRDTAIRLAWSMLVVDILVAGVVAIGWGATAGFFYLAIGLPLALFIYFRLDLVAVLLATLGLALAGRARQRSGGLAVAAGILAKVWPAVLLPVFLIQRRGRALVWCLGALVLGVVAWVAWGGLGGPIQVVTFRHARGWEIGSLVGSLVHLLGGERPHLESGAMRVGSAPLGVRLLLLVILLVVSAVIWTRASRFPRPLEGLPSLAAVAALLVLSPILSEQYIAWVVPWAAIAAASGERGVVAPTLMVTGATTLALVVPATIGGSLGDTVWYAFLLIRDLLLVVLVFEGIRHLGRPLASRAVEPTTADPQNIAAR